VLGSDLTRPESQPWKIYLASRQIQEVASDLTSAFFSEGQVPPAIPMQRAGGFPHPGILRARIPAAGSSKLADPSSLLRNVIPVRKPSPEAKIVPGSSAVGIALAQAA
jgi:hypothetical protein